MAAVNKLNQVVFLTALLSGDISLARLNWRTDLRPYNLRTSALDVLFRPSTYVLPRALRLTRTPQVLGGVLMYAYANNHFGGHTPAAIEQFRELWRGKGLPEIEKPQRQRQELSLFPE